MNRIEDYFDECVLICHIFQIWDFDSSEEPMYGKHKVKANKFKKKKLNKSTKCTKLESFGKINLSKL